MMVRDYAAFNPHATFTWRAPGEEWTIERTDPKWAKWKPTDPTSPHWYNPDRLRMLIAAYLGKEREGTPARTVREFVSEFKGLSGSAKQKAVTERAHLAGAYLHDLVAGDDVDMVRVKPLLTAMQEESRAVKPDALGGLGEDHLKQYMAAHQYVDADTVRYKKVAATANGLPFLLEVAFGIHREEYAENRGRVLVGLNWTPAMKQPIRELMQLLGQARVDSFDPVVVVVHLACPRMEYTDRGKSVLALLKGA